MGLISSFVLAYHGCNSSSRRRLLAGAPFKPSANEYDWLGHGSYFWEANPRRGLDWARDHFSHPCVIGAVIDPGHCLDLFSAAGIEAVRDAYKSLRRTLRNSGLRPPKNRTGPDRLNRILDCAVIEHLCRSVMSRSYDTVRGIFREGQAIYPTAGFYEKTHIQICVRNPECIKATFRVPPSQLS